MQPSNQPRPSTSTLDLQTSTRPKPPRIPTYLLLRRRTSSQPAGLLSARLSTYFSVRYARSPSIPSRLFPNAGAWPCGPCSSRRAKATPPPFDKTNVQQLARSIVDRLRLHRYHGFELV
jgi:hypothetical protein